MKSPADGLTKSEAVAAVELFISVAVAPST
jgi:hypothetical protein